MDLAAGTVADGLRSETTRAATLDALEALAPPISSPVALAAAPALVDVIATETERASFDRCGLLLTRLLDEAAPDPAAVYGAAFGSKRLAALYAPALLVEAVQRALSAGQPLTRADARSYACLMAWDGPTAVRGYRVPCAAAGRTAMEFAGIVSCSPPASCPSLPRAHPRRRCAQWMSVEPILSRKKMPSDDVPRQMLTLLVELLRSGELPELAIGGA